MSGRRTAKSTISTRWIVALHACKLGIAESYPLALLFVSTPWRERIVTIGVAFADSAILSMNEHLGTLFARDLAGYDDCPPLCRVDGSGFPITYPLDRPTVGVGYNMLIFLKHFTPNISILVGIMTICGLIIYYNIAYINQIMKRKCKLCSDRGCG